MNYNNTPVSPPDAKQLQLFESLYTSASLTRSAEKLGVAQPTVSIWLAKLRAHFDDELFVRTAAGMKPTPRADALIGYVREALKALARLSEAQAVFDPKRSTRSFRIAMSDAANITLLPPVFSRVRSIARGVRLEASRIDGDLARAMQDGEVDLAIGLLPQLEAGFYQQTFFSQDWICLASRSHPRIKSKITRSQYQAEAHIQIAAGVGGNLLANALAQHNIKRSIELELPGFLGLSGVLSETDLIATLPRQIGETLAKIASLQVLVCPFSIEGFMVKQHWHARYHSDSGNQWLRAVCANLFLKQR